MISNLSSTRDQPSIVSKASFYKNVSQDFSICWLLLFFQTQKQFYHWHLNALTFFKSQFPSQVSGKSKSSLLEFVDETILFIFFG